MTRVFLSYSHGLFEALQAQKHNLWVNFEDMPYSAERLSLRFLRPVLLSFIIFYISC